MEYITDNFFLLCIIGGLIFILIDHFRDKKKDAKYGVLILTLVLILSITNMVERIAKENENIFVATLFDYFGIAFRPFAIYLFIRLSGHELKMNKWIFLIPLWINAFIYLSAFFFNNDFLHHLTFYFEVVEGETGLIIRHGPLYFFSHIISLVYLGYLIYVSLKKLQGKDYLEGISLLVCTFFVIASVVLGSFGITRNLLNTTIAISCLFYYLFLAMQQNKRDSLTKLYDRKSYYKDVNKRGKNFNAVIQIDMNGLKTINDNNGHEEGDGALKEVANALVKFSSRDMYIYRLGGDEFTVLMMHANEKIIRRYVEDIHDYLDETPYNCSIGYCLKTNGESFSEISRKAEQHMYEEKERYYKETGLERRKANK